MHRFAESCFRYAACAVRYRERGEAGGSLLDGDRDGDGDGDARFVWRVFKLVGLLCRAGRLNELVPHLAVLYALPNVPTRSAMPGKTIVKNTTASYPAQKTQSSQLCSHFLIIFDSKLARKSSIRNLNHHPTIRTCLPIVCSLRLIREQYIDSISCPNHPFFSIVYQVPNISHLVFPLSPVRIEDPSWRYV